MTSRVGSPPAVVLSCEHGGNTVPRRYRSLFSSSGALQALESHRGWDIGSLQLARHFESVFETPLFASRTTRLLIELNRSLGHPRLFSEWSQRLCVAERQRLIDTYYQPYREQVVAAIDAAHQKGCSVLHLSVHTFTPVWNETPRRTDIGLLFDPAREQEAALCAAWQRQLRQSLPQLQTHRNRPYRGTSDGLTTSLRRRFPGSAYLGIELEVNQRFFDGSLTRTLPAVREIATCLQMVLSQHGDQTIVRRPSVRRASLVERTGRSPVDRAAD